MPLVSCVVLGLVWLISKPHFMCHRDNSTCTESLNFTSHSGLKKNRLRLHVLIYMMYCLYSICCNYIKCGPLYYVNNKIIKTGNWLEILSGFTHKFDCITWKWFIFYAYIGRLGHGLLGKWKSSEQVGQYLWSLIRLYQSIYQGMKSRFW